jgi:hypothetical protein
MDRNAVLVPSDLFRLGTVANFCWRQFDAYHGQDAFARYLPLDKEFSDGDFEQQNRQGSDLRTLRAFQETLTNPQSWSFTDTRRRSGSGHYLATQQVRSYVP